MSGKTDQARLISTQTSSTSDPQEEALWIDRVAQQARKVCVLASVQLRQAVEFWWDHMDPGECSLNAFEGTFVGVHVVPPEPNWLVEMCCGVHLTCLLRYPVGERVSCGPGGDGW